MAGFAIAAPAAVACEEFMPTSAIAKGMTGTGWTVERGRTPEPFGVEVLGVLPNAIAPGRDMVLVEATSPAIGRAGGAWAGMSGSPVYVDGKLIGAVSLGLGTPTGATTVAGLTPAEEMARVLTYPRLRGSAAAGASDDGSVILPDALAREVAARTGVGPARTDALAPLKVPFAVSGVPAQGIRFVRRFAEARKLPLIPYVGSSAAVGGATAAGPLRPGDNFAAVSSVGDVTTAGLGTTTYVCNGQALAFGHPLEFGGSTTLGANHADALTVVPDRFGGAFKIAAIGDSVGRVDEDRLSAVRAILGEAPDATPIRSTVMAPGLGARRDGATDSFSPGMTPFLTFLHLMGNIASTFDSIGPGTASVSWAVEGTRAGGASWRLSRSNLHASEWEIASEAAWELATHLELVVGNPFEDVTVTGVRTTASVEEAVRRYSVRRVLVSTGGGPFRVRRVVRARPGARVAVRVVLAPFERGSNRRADFAFRLPRRGQPVGLIEIGGAGGDMGDECLIEEECEGSGPEFRSFDGILRHLAGAPRNDVLSATLRLGPRMRVAQKRERRLPGVVSGHALVMIGRGGRGGGGDEEAEAVFEEPMP